jgi:hypothetical protein
MFFCAISGEPPQNPVVSKKSGHVYERRLILKYITDNGTDPVTGEKLEESDLVAVKASTFSRYSILHPHAYLSFHRPRCCTPKTPFILLHPGAFADPPK